MILIGNLDDLRCAWRTRILSSDFFTALGPMTISTIKLLFNIFYRV